MLNCILWLFVIVAVAAFVKKCAQALVTLATITLRVVAFVCNFILKQFRPIWRIIWRSAYGAALTFKTILTNGFKHL